MRIEKRGDTECLVGAPAEETGCGALWYGWLQCRHHLDGEHVGISSVRPDGSVHVLKRWPIEPAVAPASAPPRSAEEIAREVVVDAGWLQFGTNGVRLASDVSVPHARAIIAAAIERDRAERQPAQPRDLAGRIRALVQQKAGEWACETCGLRGEELYQVMVMLRAALHRKALLVAASGCVDEMRKRASAMKFAPSGDATRATADELEAIIRECQEGR